MELLRSLKSPSWICLRGPLRDGEGKKKRDVKELGSAKGRRGERKVGEWMGLEGQG